MLVALGSRARNLRNRQLMVDTDEFEHVIGWVDEHRIVLDVFVHPLTGDALDEHTRPASRLGDEVA